MKYYNMAQEEFINSLNPRDFISKIPQFKNDLVNPDIGLITHAITGGGFIDELPRNTMRELNENDFNTSNGIDKGSTTHRHHHGRKKKVGGNLKRRNSPSKKMKNHTRRGGSKKKTVKHHQKQQHGNEKKESGGGKKRVYKERKRHTFCTLKKSII